MAAEEGVAHTTGHAAKNGAAIFTKKVGPLPAYAWMAAAIVLYLYFKKRNAATAASGAANATQTDASGTSGNIDPATGYVYGTTADTQALAADNSSTGQTSGGSGSTVAGQYATNQAWAEAAINYLVGLGIDPVEANSAVTQYVSSQILTTQQQADVNLAVQGIGGPPNPPTPGNAPPPVQTPPSPGATTASNPPTGFTVTSKTDTTATLSWNSVTNATAYVIGWSASSGTGASTTVGGTTLNTTVSGLSPNTAYTFSCQATPAKAGDPSATTTATTNKTTIQGSGPTPVGNTTTVTVVPFANPAPWNSTLSGIASHYNTTVAAIQKLNPSITNVNLIHPGQQIIVPTS